MTMTVEVAPLDVGEGLAHKYGQRDTRTNKQVSVYAYVHYAYVQMYKNE